MRLPRANTGSPVSDAPEGGPKRGVRYLLVGAVNTALGLTVFTSLQLLLGEQLTYVGVLLITHVVGVLVAFALYRWYVFRVTGHVLRDLLRFWSVYLAGLGLNVVVLAVGVEVLHQPAVLVQAAVFVGTPLLTYVGHSRFSFRRKPALPVDAGQPSWHQPDDNHEPSPRTPRGAFPVPAVQQGPVASRQPDVR